METYSVTSVEQMRLLGVAFAAKASAGDVFALVGDLGTGKTEFARGFVSHFSKTVEVRSPSFPIVYEYNTGDVPIFHFDFYRLKNAEELIEIGFKEYLQRDGICLIEWADMFAGSLPEKLLTVTLTDCGNNVRKVDVDR